MDLTASIEANSSITSHANLSLSVHQIKALPVKKDMSHIYSMTNRALNNEPSRNIRRANTLAMQGLHILVNSPLFANRRYAAADRLCGCLTSWCSATALVIFLQIGNHNALGCRRMNPRNGNATPILPSKSSVNLRREAAQNTFTPISTQNVDLYVCQLTGFCQQIARKHTA
ncbi:hypothetical protein P4S73_24930 [Paraglaciecola sp. Hal342]